MDREQKQLISGIKHYWSLCKRHYPNLHTKTNYLNESGENDRSASLYRMHLASCCFRIASIVEKSKKRKSIYKSMLNDKNYKLDASGLSFLIRDTVSHPEESTNDYYEARRKYLANLTIGDIHFEISNFIKTLGDL
jgi:hypothetical protein